MCSTKLAKPGIQIGFEPMERVVSIGQPHGRGEIPLGKGENSPDPCKTRPGASTLTLCTLQMDKLHSLDFESPLPGHTRDSQNGSYCSAQLALERSSMKESVQRPQYLTACYNSHTILVTQAPFIGYVRMPLIWTQRPPHPSLEMVFRGPNIFFPLLQLPRQCV